MNDSTVLFREVQRFRQWWLLLIIGGGGVGIPLLVLSSNLAIEVRTDALYVRYFPFHRDYRRFEYDHIVSAAARTYNPIGEYGGWGLRGGARNGAYNVSGNRGVQLVFTNGNRLLLGSLQADELAAAIRAHRPFVEVQRNTGWMLLLGLIPVGFIALFAGMKLVTEVRADGIYVRFVPFHFKFLRLPLDRIQSAEARTYSPIREYGGWGIRGWGKNKAYNVSGNRGVQLLFTDGKRLLIGSQRGDELAAAIATAQGQ